MLNLLCDKGPSRYLQANGKRTSETLVFSGPVALIYLGNALQEVRLCTAPASEKVGLVETVKFLCHMAEKSTDTAYVAICDELADRYAASFREATASVAWRNGVESTLYPPVSDLASEEEAELLETIESLLENRRRCRLLSEAATHEGTSVAEVCRFRAQHATNLLFEVKIEVTEPTDAVKTEDSYSVSSTSLIKEIWKR